MNLNSQIELSGYGTSEGTKKAWDSRGRKSDPWREFRNYKPDPNAPPCGDLCKSTTDFKVDGAGGQTDSSSFVGRKYYVVDRYGHATSEHDMPEEAEHAAQAKPWGRVVSKARATETQEVRDIVRRRQVKTNPDID